MKRSILIVIFSFFSLIATAHCSEYSDPSGYSFSYPEGWYAAGKLTGMSEKLPRELGDWIAKNNVDLDKISVVLLRAGRGDFLENMNVVVLPQEISINDKTMKELSDEIPQQYHNMGASIAKLESSLQKIGENNAMELNYESHLPGVPYPLRQRQAYFSGGGKSYIVTCTGKADAFEKYSPVFDNILSSFKVPPSSSTGFKGDRILILAIVGGVLGLIFGIIKKVLGRA